MRRAPFLLVFGIVAWNLIWNSSVRTAEPKRAGRLRDATLADKAIEVLGGRLTIRVPEGARVEARAYPIMGAPTPQTHESRVVLDADQERLVVLVNEVFAFAGEDFEKDITEWVSKRNGKYRVEAVRPPAKGLEAVVVTPLTSPDHSRSNDAAFVEGIFVKSGDRTVQSLDVYVNKAAEKDLTGCSALAHQIILSVAPGEKGLELSAGERRLFAYSKDVEISVTVDENTVATTQVGPDFLVHRLVALAPLGADSVSIGVYVGNHPDFEPEAKRIPGRVFGKNVDWQPFREGKGLQTLCDLPIPGENGLKAHVWIHASTDGQLAAMKKTAETMTLVKVKRIPAK